MRRNLQYIFGIALLLIAGALLFIPIFAVETAEDESTTYAVPIVWVGICVFFGLGFVFKALTNKDKSDKELVETFSDDREPNP